MTLHDLTLSNPTKIGLTVIPMSSQVTSTDLSRMEPHRSSVQMNRSIWQQPIRLANVHRSRANTVSTIIRNMEGIRSERCTILGVLLLVVLLREGTY